MPLSTTVQEPARQAPMEAASSVQDGVVDMQPVCLPNPTPLVLALCVRYEPHADDSHPDLSAAYGAGDKPATDVDARRRNILRLDLLRRAVPLPPRLLLETTMCTITTANRPLRPQKRDLDLEGCRAEVLPDSKCEDGRREPYTR